MVVPLKVLVSRMSAPASRNAVWISSITCHRYDSCHDHLRHTCDFMSCLQHSIADFSANVCRGLRGKQWLGKDADGLLSGELIRQCTVAWCVRTSLQKLGLDTTTSSVAAHRTSTQHDGRPTSGLVTTSRSLLPRSSL